MNMDVPMGKMNEATENAGRCGAIILYLHRLGYDDFNGRLEMINTIRKNKIDISKYKLPYNAKDLDEWEQQELKVQENLKRIDKNYQKLLGEGKVMTLIRDKI